MNCPDLDRLIDLVQGDLQDPELRQHLSECPSCQAELNVLFRLSAAWERALEVPDGLVERALARLPSEDRNVVPLRKGVLTGVLGALTASGGLVVSGTMGEAGILFPLLLSGIVGSAALVFQLRWDTWVERRRA